MKRSLTLYCALPLFCWFGCSTVPKNYADPDGTVYQDAKHLFRVWYAGADLSKFDTLYIAPIESTVPAQRSSEEAEQFERARNELRIRLFVALEAKRVFSSIILDHVHAKSGAKVLTLRNTVVDYKPGSAALRITVGFGAGWPAIMCRGSLTDGDETLFRYVAKRGFEPGPAAYDDETLVTEYVRDLANDLCDHIVHLKSTGQILIK